MKTVKENKIIIKASAEGKGDEEFELPANKQVYQLNLKTGYITLADMSPIVGQPRKNLYRLTEILDGFHVYLPALNKEHAKTLFNGILSGRYK